MRLAGHNPRGGSLASLLLVVLGAPLVAQESSQPADSPAEGTPTAPVDTEMVRLHLVDGSVITGKFSISQIAIDTEYGRLDVPVSKLLRIIPGLVSRPDLDEKIENLFDELASDDEKRGETAQKELIDLGPKVVELVEFYRGDSSPQRAKRIETILEKLEELTEQMDEDLVGPMPPPWVHDDTVETTEFTVVGKVSPQSFTFANQFGTLTVELADIQYARRLQGNQRSDVRRSLALDGTYLAQLKYKSSQIRVERGDRITVQADGSISRAGSSTYKSGPDGNARLGNFSQNPQILGGALVAKIGGSPVIRIGSKHTFTASRSGTLQFAIGMRPDYVGRYQFPGKYNLKIKVSPAPR